MTTNTKNKVKQSFILGSLTSSAGVFISKIIGLFYIVPFTSLATERNMTFYSAPYSFYTILLQVCTAGLPFATAAIVAKYANREDWKSVMAVRRLSLLVLSISGFVMGLLFFACSGLLASRTLGDAANSQDIAQMRNTFMILSLALLLVPILSSYRGFYQGLKDLKVYADTQVLEQFGRVAFLLLFGWILVRLLQMNHIYAVYMAVLATSIGAGIAILYYLHYDKRHIGPILRSSRSQETPGEKYQDLLKELFIFGLPYLIGAVIGNSQALVNTRFFITTATASGMNYEKAKLLYGIIQVQCDKLTSIPQVLAIGFSAGVVPYMTVALENDDMSLLQKNIRECIETVLFVAVPICFSMFALARPIYFIMYGNLHLDYGETCLSWASLLALVTTITPICSSMMMTLRLRRESIFYLFVGFVIKIVSFFPLMNSIGYIGAIISSILCSAAIIYLDLAKIKNRYYVTYTNTWIRFFKIIIACLAMNGIYALLRLAGITFSETSRILALIQLALYGICGVSIYLIVCDVFQLPQGIFRKSLKQMGGEVLKRFLKKA